MRAWQFDAATTLLDQADQVLAQRTAIQSVCGSSTTLPAKNRRHSSKRRSARIGRREDSDDLAVLINDRQPADLLRFHQFDGGLDVLILADRIDRLRHHVAD